MIGVVLAALIPVTLLTAAAEAGLNWLIRIGSASPDGDGS